MGEPQCALWYGVYRAPHVELFDSEQEAASYGVSMEEGGHGSVSGIQYSDGRFVAREEWQAYREETDRRAAETLQEVEDAKLRPVPPMRSVRVPYDPGGYSPDASIPADYPEWVGRRE